MPQYFNETDPLCGGVTCRNCGWEMGDYQYTLSDVPMACPECQQMKVRPDLAIDAEAVQL